MWYTEYVKKTSIYKSHCNHIHTILEDIKCIFYIIYNFKTVTIIYMYICYYLFSLFIYFFNSNDQVHI